MCRYRLVTAVIAFVCGHVLAENAWGLAMETMGNRPLSKKNYSQWNGIVPLVNDEARVYESWANGNEYLFYRGTTKELNAALAHFAKVEVENHVVVLRAGPGMTHSFDRKQIPCNWVLHVIGGLARTQVNDDIEDLEWQKDPVLTIYISGDIDLDKIKIPAGVTFRGAPENGDEMTTNAEERKKIAEFLERTRAAQK